MGQRVDAFAFDLWKDGAWTEFASGTSVGSCRLIWVGDTSAPKVRLRITRASEPPALSELGVYQYQGVK
jgi:alpha-L-fucosidase